MTGHIDALGLAEAIRNGETTAAEQTEAAIARITERNGELNAVVSTRYDEARAEVEAGLPHGPLSGVPFLVKDLGVHVAGLPNTRGSKLWADAVGTVDSDIIRRYKQAGLVLLGLTNTPELGKNASTEPALFGPTHNPWKRDVSPGGSSGGSAAAVASGMVPVAHGNDGGGSVRIPSACTGLYGLKPSRGRSSLWPDTTAFGNPTTVAHALTTTVRDSAALLDVIAGGTHGEPFGARGPATTFLDEVGKAPGALRIGVVTELNGPVPTDPEAVAGVRNAADLLTSLGHHVEDVKASWDVIEVALCSATLMGATLVGSVNSRLAELGRELREDDLEPFTHALVQMYADQPMSNLEEALRQAVDIGFRTGAVFADYDLLLTPSMAAPAPDHGLLDTTSTEAMFTHGTTYSAWTSVFNVTGSPAASIPFGLFSKGVPMGIQLVADMGREDLILQVSAQLEQAAPWAHLAPGYTGISLEA